MRNKLDALVDRWRHEIDSYDNLPNACKGAVSDGEMIGLARASDELEMILVERTLEECRLGRMAHGPAEDVNNPRQETERK